MWLNFLLVIVSFVLLVKGADFFVKGASSLAIKLGISAFVVGLTIVAMGTSTPEVFVNVSAVLKGSAELSIGNIVGSNIVNILLGLGLASIFAPLVIKKGTVWKEIPFSLMATVLILVLSSDVFLEGKSENLISRIDGIVLLSFFVLFMLYTFSLNKIEKSDKDNGSEEIESIGLFLSFIYILGGLVALVFGGKIVVVNSVIIAQKLGITENLIGLTIIAVGTSLPEIVTSIIGARKKQFDLVIGGIIGSCIFNSLFILGLTATVGNLNFNADNLQDALVLVFANILLFFFMFVGRRHILEKYQGAILILVYVLYILFAIWRG